MHVAFAVPLQGRSVSEWSVLVYSLLCSVTCAADVERTRAVYWTGLFHSFTPQCHLITSMLSPQLVSVPLDLWCYRGDISHQSNSINSKTPANICKTEVQLKKYWNIGSVLVHIFSELDQRKKTSKYGISNHTCYLWHGRTFAWYDIDIFVLHHEITL